VDDVDPGGGGAATPVTVIDGEKEMLLRGDSDDLVTFALALVLVVLLVLRRMPMILFCGNDCDLLCEWWGFL